MSKFSARLLMTLSVAACATLPALAQRQSDPNIGHFYMARQQITITDDAPSVNDQRTTPAAAAAQGSGALPGRPMGLPRAGWQPYSQSIPSLKTSLPKTNNGVPEKAPPPQQPSAAAMRARAGALKAASAAQQKASQPSVPVVKAYSPYKQYAPDSAAAGSAALNANSAVKGSVLHWARSRKSY